MEFPVEAIYYFFAALLFGAIGMAVGERKGRKAGAFWLGALLGPLGWLIVALLPSLGPKCPHCGGDMETGFKVCRHCGREGEPLEKVVQSPSSLQMPVAYDARRSVPTIVAFLVGIVLIVGALLGYVVYDHYQEERAEQAARANIAQLIQEQKREQEKRASAEQARSLEEGSRATVAIIQKQQEQEKASALLLAHEAARQQAEAKKESQGRAVAEERLRTWKAEFPSRFAPVARAVYSEAVAIQNGADLAPGCGALASAFQSYEANPENAWPSAYMLHYGKFVNGLRGAIDACRTGNRKEMADNLLEVDAVTAWIKTG